MVNLDLRSSEWPPVGLGSLDREIRAEQETRRIYMLVCERCLCPSASEYRGKRTCLGCGRGIVYDQREVGIRP